MMRGFVKLGLIAGCIAVTSGPLFAAAVPAGIRARYTEFARLLRRGDVAAIMRETTPDFHIKTSNGQTMNRKEAEQYFRQATKAGSPPHFKVVFHHCEMSGGRVRVLSTQTMSML